jgi:hypothetical protein
LPSIFYPPFHAHSRYVSLRTSAQLSRLWWLFDCRNPATALLIRKKKFLALKRGTTFFAPCGAWGCLIADYIKTFSERTTNKKYPAPEKIKKRNNKQHSIATIIRPP